MVTNVLSEAHRSWWLDVKKKKKFHPVITWDKKLPLRAPVLVLEGKFYKSTGGPLSAGAPHLGPCGFP